MSKMSNKRITLLFMLIFLASCSSLKTVVHDDRQIDLTKDNLSLLDGEYNILSKDSSTEVSLDEALVLKHYNWVDHDGKYQLYIKVLDNRHLQINVFKNGNFFEKKTAKIKLVDGSLMIKKKTVRNVYVIFNVFSFMTTRLTLLNNGNLLVDHDNSRVGTFVILPAAGGKSHCDRLEFQRKKIP